MQPLLSWPGINCCTEYYVIKHVRPDNTFANVFLGLSLDNCGLNLSMQESELHMKVFIAKFQSLQIMH